jgi:hypothetical protein
MEPSDSIRLLAQALGADTDTIQGMFQTEPAPPQWPPSVTFPFHGSLHDLSTGELRSLVASLRAQLTEQNRQRLPRLFSRIDLFLRDTAVECQLMRRELKKLSAALDDQSPP